MAGRLTRVETRRRAGRFVQALLADLPRKNCWSVAEHAGDADPYGMFTVLIVEPARALACPLAWSSSRRRGRHHARSYHYLRQHAAEPWP
jgi:hypothetical protein